MGNTTELGCNELRNSESCAYVDDTGTINNDRPKDVEDKVNIIAKKK